MTPDRPAVTIAVDGDDVIVTGPSSLWSRPSRLFFRSVLGANQVPEGWRCPRRRDSLPALIVRINTFAERQGWQVTRDGIADREVEREIERRRSFARTRAAAAEWKAGEPVIDIDDVLDRLRAFGWSENRVLRPHQRQAAAHALVVANAANFSVPGSGKTATALAVAATHLAAGTIDLVVVVGPLACFAPWESETRLAVGSSIRTRRVRGTMRHRRSIYAATRPNDLLLLSYASAAADRSVLIDLAKAHNVMLVVDESHRIKRFRGGLWAPALMAIAAHARVRMILSGTPMPQGGRDLFSQLNVLWPGGELTGPRDAFANRVDSDFGGVVRDAFPFVARTPKAALGLPPYTVHRHIVPLEGTQAEIYDLIVNNFRRRLEDAATWADKLDALRRARPVRLLQAAANPDLFNRADRFYRLPRVELPNPTLMDRLATYPHHEEPAKSLAALAILAGAVADDEKAVCWSNFIGNLDHFVSLVRDRLGVPCFQVDGRVPAGDDEADDDPGGRRPNPDDLDTRERIIERFLVTAGPAVLVANPASSSESISLHRACHNAIYLDRTYDCAQFLQSIDRIHRLGLPLDAQVNVHILLATRDAQPTIDHLVDASLLGKEDMMRNLLEGAELLPIALSADPAVDADGDDQDLGALLRYLLGEREPA